MSRTELPLQSSGRKPLISVLLIVGIFVLAGLGALVGIVRDPPADPTVVPIVILFIAIMSLSPIPLIRLVSRARAYVENGELVMITGVGKKRIALANLRRHGLVVVDLKQRISLTPRLRLWGASMSGLNAGWFKLRNGEKAVCLITERNRVSYLRSDTDNVSLLLSLENPATLKSLLDRS
jgi:Bacterial PH domain